MAHTEQIQCKKCGGKFGAFIPDGAKWIECPFCKHKMRIK